MSTLFDYTTSLDLFCVCLTLILWEGERGSVWYKIITEGLTTTILSAPLMVDSLCAITIVVLFLDATSWSKAAWTMASLSESKALVASVGMRVCVYVRGGKSGQLSKSNLPWSFVVVSIFLPSSSKIPGSLMIHLAKAILCFWPPVRMCARPEFGDPLSFSSDRGVL